MTLVRCEPFGYRNRFSGVDRMHRDMARFFSSFDDNENNSVIEWKPRSSVVDLDDKYEITSELPGMSREDVSIELDNGILTISGEKKEQHDSKERNLHLNERAFGMFRRSFRLQPEIDGDQIEAKFDNGILTVTLPKPEKAVAKKIEIQA